MKKTLLFFGLLCSLTSFSQITLIPDANFEQSLITSGIDTDGIINGQMATADAAGVTSLLIGLANISDLTGIEAFTSLVNLSATQNNLTSLDLSAITTLELITVWGNNLISIDISTNTSLRILYCSDNQLPSLDISNNPLIDELYFENNLITGSFDLSNHNLLADAVFYNNQITSVIVNSNNSLLINLDCSNNLITSLNVSGLPVLVDFLCSDNLLTCLNVKNGNNTNFTTFVATNNPSLTCIEVDNVAYSNANWTNKDAGASYSINCGTPCTVGINEYELAAFSIFPNPSSSLISLETESDVEAIKIIDLTGKTVKIVTSNSKSIDISELTNGIYFVQLKVGGELITKKFVKN